MFSALLSTEAGFGKNRFEPCSTKLECAARSVVSLLPNWPAGFSRNEEPEGSGVVLADGRIVATADHVLGPAKSALIRTISGEIISAEIMMRDPLTDVAFLRIEDSLPPFDFSYETAMGQQACALGNSFGLDISLACGVISAKQVSGVGFNQIEDFIQTDASVNPGMSGGALIDKDGKLIGMLSAIFTRQSDANIGVNFAVSADLLSRLLDDFEDDGSVSHRRSGLVLRPSKAASDQDGMIGLEVVRVKSDSIEENAGIKPGDVILYADERRIKRAGAYAAALALLRGDGSLKLSILRQGKMIEITVNYQ